MSRFPTIGHPWVTLLVFFLLLEGGIAWAEKLHPVCGGKEYEVAAMGQTDAVLLTIGEPTSTFVLHCLAYEVTAQKSGDSQQNYCVEENEGAAPYRLVLRATYTTPEGVTGAMDYDVRDAVGGSITGMTMRLPHPSRLSLVFVNEEKDDRCVLRARVLMTYAVGEAIQEKVLPPALVKTHPSLIYANSGARTYFALRHPSGTQGADAATDFATLIDASSTCANVSAMQYMEYHATKPSAMEIRGYDASYSIRSYSFYDPGVYRVCYRGPDYTSAVELAVLSVFDGNPTFYDIISGQAEDGMVIVKTPITVKFFGYDLDTRPDGDTAKFVAETAACEGGKPIGGVPMATNLEPAGRFGPNVTFVLWNVTLLEAGGFKVCYRRSKAGVWTEVPLITDANPVAPWTPSPGEYPTPRDPVTGDVCPTAPESTPAHPWVRYKGIKLVLAGSVMPKDFIATVSHIFCIPRAAIVFAHLTHEKVNKVVFMSIVCEDVNRTLCSSVERQNYIVSLGDRNASLLTSNGIIAAKGSQSMFAFDDDNVVIIHSRSSMAASLVVSITLLVVAGLLLFAVYKYKEKRQYFVQFGMDGDDIGDMYEEGAVPAQAGGSGTQACPASGRGATRNAFIEMEE